MYGLCKTQFLYVFGFKINYWDLQFGRRFTISKNYINLHFLKLFVDYFVMFSSIFRLESMEKLEEERVDNENEEKVMFEYSNVGDKREKTIKLVKQKSSFMNY